MFVRIFKILAIASQLMVVTFGSTLSPVPETLSPTQTMPPTPPPTPIPTLSPVPRTLAPGTLPPLKAADTTTPTSLPSGTLEPTRKVETVAPSAAMPDPTRGSPTRAPTTPAPSTGWETNEAFTDSPSSALDESRTLAPSLGEWNETLADAPTPVPSSFATIRETDETNVGALTRAPTEFPTAAPIRRETPGGQNATEAPSAAPASCPGRNALVTGTLVLELGATQTNSSAPDEEEAELLLHIVDEYTAILRESYPAFVGMSLPEFGDTFWMSHSYSLGFSVLAKFAPCAPPPEELNSVFVDADYPTILNLFVVSNSTDSIFHHLTGDATYEGTVDLEDETPDEGNEFL